LRRAGIVALAVGEVACIQQCRGGSLVEVMLPRYLERGRKMCARFLRVAERSGDEAEIIFFGARSLDIANSATQIEGDSIRALRATQIPAVLCNAAKGARRVSCGTAITN